MTTDDPFTSPSEAPGPAFRARFEGDCSRCCAEILPGEEIQSDGRGEWQHIDCEEA